jgi:hypothetical protein
MMIEQPSASNGYPAPATPYQTYQPRFQGSMGMGMGVGMGMGGLGQQSYQQQHPVLIRQEASHEEMEAAFERALQDAQEGTREAAVQAEVTELADDGIVDKESKGDLEA